MKIINLTKADVPIAIHSSIETADRDGVIECSVIYEPSGKVATPHWVNQSPTLLEVNEPVGDFLYIGERYALAITHLPNVPKDGVIYIVEQDVARMVPDRADVFFPDPDNIWYDEHGNILAHRGLLRYYDKWMQKANHWIEQCDIVHENLMELHAILDDPKRRSTFLNEIDQNNQENAKEQDSELQDTSDKTDRGR